MQKTTEKWVYVAARAPNSKDPRTILRQRKIPTGDWGWILNLRGRNIHNAAAAVMDYRTGEVLAYVGSASYTGKGNKKFQPQFDVLSDGWRQPGSSIKPIDYAIGIDDETLTASTMFMDVVADFGRGFTPTQADKMERGPVRAAQRAPVLAQHPRHQGHDHAGPRAHVRAEQGLRPCVPADGDPGRVDGHRDARDAPHRHAVGLLRRSPTAACGCPAS